jgi:hypothetical protein
MIPTCLKKASAALPAFVGVLLILAGVANTIVQQIGIPAFGSESFWATLVNALPTPGGVGPPLGPAPAPTPELDPASIASAVSLAIGGTLLIVDRWRKRRLDSASL